MVREMSDQLLETPNHPVDEDEEELTGNESTEEEDEEPKVFSRPMVNNFMEPPGAVMSSLPSGSADFDPRSNR